jgi:uncharacterized protein YdaU (DUF1376 family)
MGLPYSKFFWADYMRATRMLSCTAKGAWMDILCLLADADDCGTLTNSATAWARYIGLTKDELLGVVQELEAGGVGNIKIEGETLSITSNRLKKDFKEYKAQCDQAAQAGKKSGAARRKKNTNDRSTTVQRETNDRSTTVAIPLERNANETSTIPEARSQKLESLSKKKTPNGSERENSFAEIPTWDEVWDHAQIRGILRETAESFFNWHQDNDYWLNKFGKPINWKSKLQNWKVKGQTFQANGKAPKRQKMTSAELLERIKDAD